MVYRQQVQGATLINNGVINTADSRIATLDNPTKPRSGSPTLAEDFLVPVHKCEAYMNTRK